ARLVEAAEQGHGLPLGRSPASDLQQLRCRPGPLELSIRKRETGRREMDVAVDEARKDRHPVQVHGAVGRRWIPRPDTLDVAVVDEDPLPRRWVPERVDPACAVKGPHQPIIPATLRPMATRDGSGATRVPGTPSPAKRSMTSST